MTCWVFGRTLGVLAVGPSDVCIGVWAYILKKDLVLPFQDNCGLQAAARPDSRLLGQACQEINSHENAETTIRICYNG